MQDFHQLIHELGQIIDIELEADKNNACAINFSDELTVQLEIDPDERHLLMATFIQELPAGKFRENVLTSGLKYNNLAPRTGTLCYCPRNNNLAFFMHLPLENLTATMLSVHLNAFLEEGKLWKKHISKGTLPPLEIPGVSKEATIFDIKNKT
jgi:hypothetical protein